MATPISRGTQYTITLLCKPLSERNPNLVTETTSHSDHYYNTYTLLLQHTIYILYVSESCSNNNNNYIYCTGRLSLSAMGPFLRRNNFFFESSSRIIHFRFRAAVKNIYAQQSAEMAIVASGFVRGVNTMRDTLYMFVLYICYSRPLSSKRGIFLNGILMIRDGINHRFAKAEIRAFFFPRPCRVPIYYIIMLCK